MTLLTRAEDVGLELSERLQSCTVEQGAETDLGVAVYRGRRQPDETMIPCSVVIEGDDHTQDSRATQVKQAKRYVLFAYVKCDPRHPNDAAHAAIRDIKRAVFRTRDKPDTKLGGKVREVTYLGSDIGPRADGAAFVLAAVEVGVEFVEDLANP